MTMTDALRDDLRRVDEIACTVGQHLTEPVQTDDDYINRCVYALAVAVEHLIEAEIRRREKDAGT